MNFEEAESQAKNALFLRWAQGMVRRTCMGCNKQITPGKSFCSKECAEKYADQITASENEVIAKAIQRYREEDDGA